MHTVIEIMYKEIKVTKDTGKQYTITTLRTSTGDEAEYYGDDVYLGDPVMIFYHKGKIKARK